MEQPIFRWETLKVIARQVLYLKERNVAGATMEVELTGGSRIRAFRADDGAAYFCHGLSFGGKDAPGGAISPYSGAPVRTILEDFSAAVSPESAAAVSDIVVWIDLDGDPIHSALLLGPTIAAGTDRLDYSSMLRSKNGLRPEADVTLESLVAGDESYGETYVVYRRR